MRAQLYYYTHRVMRVVVGASARVVEMVMVVMEMMEILGGGHPLVVGFALGRAAARMMVLLERLAMMAGAGASRPAIEDVKGTQLRVAAP